MSRPAAGIVFAAPNQNGALLFIRRADTAEDYPGHWCFAGGWAEGDESPEANARREATEEIGPWPDTALVPLATSDDGTVRFTTFLARVPEPFQPTLSDEHDGFVWASARQPPQPLHPGDDAILTTLTGNEQDVAQLVASGALVSGTKFRNIWLYAIRIIGTGAAYRRIKKGDTERIEFTWRDPDIFLSPEMVARCAGLPVILEHPDGALLDGEQYLSRNVGSIMLPYIKGDEVWGIARIYDPAMAQIMRDVQLSTSPTVVLGHPDDNVTVSLDDGGTLIIEGEPALLCHVAICEQGVWDKGGAPSGIDTGGIRVTEEERAEADKKKADAEGKVTDNEPAGLHEKLDRMMEMIGGLGARVDSMEKMRKDSADGETEEKRKEREAEEKKKADAETEAKAKADAEDLKKRMDAFEEKVKPRSDDDAAMMADAQCKADSVAMAHGKRAPAPMAGETVMAYRLRVLREHQAHSPTWKGVNLGLIQADSAAFTLAEQAIFADSEKAARSPGNVPLHQLVERIRREGPHTIHEFHGDPAAWMQDFMRVNTRGSIRQNFKVGA